MEVAARLLGGGFGLDPGKSLRASRTCPLPAALWPGDGDSVRRPARRHARVSPAPLLHSLVPREEAERGTPLGAPGAAGWKVSVARLLETGPGSETRTVVTHRAQP